jgi:hypothetical protein
MEWPQYPGFNACQMQDSDRASQHCCAGEQENGHQDILETRIRYVYSENMTDNDHSVNIDDIITLISA